MKQCKNCMYATQGRWNNPITHNMEDLKGWIRCTRFPPQIYEYDNYIGYSDFPSVEDSLCCGEWTQLPAPYNPEEGEE